MNKMKPNLKTSAALRVGDTAFLRNEPMEKFIEQVASPIMDEQDEIESLKAQITKEGVTQDELHSALINALNRITGLERTLAMAERAANRAANDASCLANGIQPD